MAAPLAPPLGALGALGVRRGRRKRAWQMERHVEKSKIGFIHLYSSSFISIHLHSSENSLTLLSTIWRHCCSSSCSLGPLACGAPKPKLGCQSPPGQHHLIFYLTLAHNSARYQASPTTSVPPKTNLSVPSFRTSLASNHLPFPARSCQNDVLEVAAASSQRIAAANHSQEASSHLATAPPNITRTERSSQELDVFQPM